MITIIRIEHPDDKRGIFNSRHCRKLFKTKIYEKFNEFPSPNADPIISRPPKYKKEFCAFKSIPQVYKWLSVRERKAIIKAGFKFLIIDVTTAVIGETQILYERKNIIKVIDISNLI